MDTMQKILDIVLPANFDLAKYAMYLLIGVIGIFVVVGIFRLSFGKGSLLNSAISSAVAILCIYVITVLVYSFGTNLVILFDPLPFVSVSEDYLTVFPIFEASLQAICKEIVNLMVLSYLMNLFESWLPKGDKIWSWFCFRFLGMAISVCLYYFISILFNTVFQDSFVEKAPLILLCIVLVSFLLGCLKLLVGGALAFINPLLGLFYAFFFSKLIGKQLMRAMITTLLLTILVCVLNHFSYTVISIAAVAIITYLPVILIGLVLWYVIAKFL